MIDVQTGVGEEDFQMIKEELNPKSYSWFKGTFTDRSCVAQINNAKN